MDDLPQFFYYWFEYFFGLSNLGGEWFEVDSNSSDYESLTLIIGEIGLIYRIYFRGDVKEVSYSVKLLAGILTCFTRDCLSCWDKKKTNSSLVGI